MKVSQKSQLSHVILKERTRARRLANLAEGGRDGIPRKKQTF